MTRTPTKHKLSETARQLQGALCNALSALNEIDPDALKDWLAQADALRMDAADRALIERLLGRLLPRARELDEIFESLETAGEQLGLLDPHQFRAGPTHAPEAVAAAGRQRTWPELAGVSRAA